MTARHTATNMAPRGAKPEWVPRYTLTCNAGRLTGTPCKAAWQDPLVGPTGEARERAVRDGWVSGRYRVPGFGSGLETWGVLDLCPEHTSLVPPPAVPSPYYNEEPQP